jgi:hypothetical protein
MIYRRPLVGEGVVARATSFGGHACRSEQRYRANASGNRDEGGFGHLRASLPGDSPDSSLAFTDLRILTHMRRTLIRSNASAWAITQKCNIKWNFDLSMI